MRPKVSQPGRAISGDSHSYLWLRNTITPSHNQTKQQVTRHPRGNRTSAGPAPRCPSLDPSVRRRTCGRSEGPCAAQESAPRRRDPTQTAPARLPPTDSVRASRNSACGGASREGWALTEVSGEACAAPALIEPGLHVVTHHTRPILVVADAAADPVAIEQLRSVAVEVTVRALPWRCVVEKERLQASESRKYRHLTQSRA